MIIDVFASSSAGNCYNISDGDTSLLIECGIPFSRLQRALNFGLNKIDACLITHEHIDHSKCHQELSRRGIDIYLTEGTKTFLGANGHRYNVIKAKGQFQVKSFLILPFEVEHDAAEPVGYLLHSTKTKEKLLFITDSFYCKYTFKGLTHIMVEANFSHELLMQRYEALDVTDEYKSRLIESHFSFENLIGFFKNLDLSTVQEIYLLHLSAENSDQDKFKAEIQELTGKPVYIAKP